MKKVVIIAVITVIVFGAMLFVFGAPVVEAKDMPNDDPDGTCHLGCVVYVSGQCRVYATVCDSGLSY